MKLTFSCTSNARPLRSGHLKMGDTSADGIRFEVNNLYAVWDSMPVIPIMGEFHYSRYDARQWETELIKMKSCGISVVASYLMWIHHEEEEGIFDFNGNRNVREFVKLCEKLGLQVFLRPGPWVHGEMRNGGFPDWLLRKPFSLRENDEGYLFYVRRLFQEYFRQLKGLLYCDGGPIIGIQLENELPFNPRHLAMLKNIAEQAGFRVPLYTVTGWGPGCIGTFPENEVIPIFGGYPEAPWQQDCDPLAPSPHYCFQSGRNNNNIGNDQMKALENSSDESILQDYPYFTCELGPGVQVTYHRRPVVDPMDVYTSALTTLARGNNLPGYYVFHGGYNPVNGEKTYQESRETQYPNDLPVVSYDFQAPIGEFGFVKPSYSYYRLLHSFIRENEHSLAVCQPVPPDSAPVSLTDPSTPRFMARSFTSGIDGGTYGYVFFTTYMRTYALQAVSNVQIQLQLPQEQILISNFSIPANRAGFFPFRFSFGERVFPYLTAQPVTRVHTPEEEIYFFAAIDGVPVRIAAPNGLSITCSGTAKKEPGCTYTEYADIAPSRQRALTFTDELGYRYSIVVLPFQDALNLTHVTGEKGDYAVLCTDPVFFTQAEAWIQQQNPDPCTSIAVWQDPRFLTLPRRAVRDGIFTQYRLPGSLENPEISILPRAVPAITEQNPLTRFLFTPSVDSCGEFELSVPMELMEKYEDIRLFLAVAGDVLQIYDGQQLVYDFFNMGTPIELGLRRFYDSLKEGKPLILKVSPLAASARVYLERGIPRDCVSVSLERAVPVRKIELR